MYYFWHRIVQGYFFVFLVSIVIAEYYTDCHVSMPSNKIKSIGDYNAHR